ncbi:MAG TPA: exosortase/archaeosortase family protein [Methanomicrobia archaeon]|nr:exosortase/archaeosortase family protein [Methanomicrobia archaeon]
MKLPKTPFVILLILALLYARTFQWLVRAWLNDPYYSHGFLVMIIAGFFTWRAFRTFEPSEVRDPAPYQKGLIVFAVGLFLYTAGFITLFPFLMALSFLFTLSGLVLFFYGKPLMRALLFPIAYLMFAIPLPAEFLDLLGYQLQALSARYPAALLTLLGIPVTRVGAEIYLADAAFTIGLPCSGMNSLIALLALAALFTVLLQCAWYRKVALFCSAVPIALFANITRVTALLLIGHRYGAETATGFYHTLFSPLLFIIAFICLIGLSILTGCKVRV